MIDKPQFREMDGEVHLRGVMGDGEFTLCGDAFDTGPVEWRSSSSRVVTCPRCIRIILYCCQRIQVAGGRGSLNKAVAATSSTKCGTCGRGTAMNGACYDCDPLPGAVLCECGHVRAVHWLDQPCEMPSATPCDCKKFRARVRVRKEAGAGQ